ncbi:MAG: DUF5615 family PIN-like protein [Candidatus Ozemobacteraceae bacterium]
MRFIADECCDFAIVKALREAGHDVMLISQIKPGATDSEVVKIALHEKLIILTEDKDFGQLVYAAGKQAIGVFFFRFPSAFRKQIANDVVKLVHQMEVKLHGCFVTIQLGKVRISRPFEPVS